MSVCSECAAEQPTAIPVGLSHSASLARLILTVPDSSSLSLDIPPSLAPEPPDAGSPDGGLTAACRTLVGQGTLSRQLQTRRLPATPVPIGYCARKRRFSYFRIEQSSKRLHVARGHNHPSGDIDQPGVFVPPTMLAISSQAGWFREPVAGPRDCCADEPCCSESASVR